MGAAADIGNDHIVEATVGFMFWSENAAGRAEGDIEGILDHIADNTSGIEVYEVEADGGYVAAKLLADEEDLNWLLAWR